LYTLLLKSSLVSLTAQSQKARSLYKYILKYLKECGLNPNAKLLAQSYDGASVISGIFNSIQALIKYKFL